MTLDELKKFAAKVAAGDELARPERYASLSECEIERLVPSDADNIGAVYPPPTTRDTAPRKEETGKLIRLPAPVAAIYRAVAALEAAYPGRKFTPDGHLVGSLGEVVAASELGLNLHKMGHPGHDAYDAEGDVEIKMTQAKSIGMYSECVRLVVLKIVSPEAAEIVYDGPGKPAWAAARNPGKNGQRVITLAKLREIAVTGSSPRRLTTEELVTGMTPENEHSLEDDGPVGDELI